MMDKYLDEFHPQAINPAPCACFLRIYGIHKHPPCSSRR